VKKFILSALFLLAIFASRSQTIDCSASKKIKDTLQVIYEKDQATRKILLEQLRKNGGKQGSEILETAKKIKESDKENQGYISQLLDQCGWPGYLDSTGNNAIFLVIDHAQLDFKEKYFPMVKEQAEKGHVEKTDMLTLQDRILMKKDLKQLYGTQSFKANDNTTLIWPVESPDSLEIRRKDAGFPSMDTYLQLLQQTTGNEVKWDRNLTIEEAKKLKRSPSVTEIK
jgi:hypothetical protein